MRREKTLRLILGDQLNSNHSWFRENPRDTAYVMMEVRQETDYALHHIQKVAGFFAAMRGFSDQLTRLGHRVYYLRLDDPENEQDIEDNLRKLIKKHGSTRLEYLLPDEYRLDRQLEGAASRLPVPVKVTDTEHFLTRREDLKKFFQDKKRFLMESFYRQMRKKHTVLLERNGTPMGSAWNFDKDNRNPYDGAVSLPPAMVFQNDVSDIVEMIARSGVKTMGQIEPKRFIWPIKRKQALEQLHEFFRERLPHFGTYQDSMTTKSWSLFHSRLSFALNTKMLHPMEVIRAAVGRARSRSGKKVGIEQLEGFVRQILGWREYMRGVYWALMPRYQGLNYFEHKGTLPDFYWTGKTTMHCLSTAITQSLEHAYAHHIQRLMITGNFALLSGVHPDEVDAWYLGIYVDAVQWVEMVNTRGMSQFADGGLVATKPYVSSANYIQKMSDYCDHCRYNPRKKTGEQACPFNSLYWDFFIRNRPKLEKNPRVAVTYRSWDRMDGRIREALLEQAKQHRAQLNG